MSLREVPSPRLAINTVTPTLPRPQPPPACRRGRGLGAAPREAGCSPAEGGRVPQATTTSRWSRGGRGSRLHLHRGSKPDPPPPAGRREGKRGKPGGGCLAEGRSQAIGVVRPGEGGSGRRFSPGPKAAGSPLLTPPGAAGGRGGRRSCGGLRGGSARGEQQMGAGAAEPRPLRGRPGPGGNGAGEGGSRRRH